MDVRQIKDPSFLKNLNNKECEQLASDIRTFMIQSVSQTGGHLASNLGVVELTIAVHKVFDSPNDKIFFDVGHQSYTHKILTGRANQFSTLRKHNGLSGFEKRHESVHDVWEAGHSSTSLSAALGMAVARDLNHQDYEIVPIIGDGALSSGMALEALNQIGDQKRHMVIIFNDNNMSITKNVGALTKDFARLRTNKKYNSLKYRMKAELLKTGLGKEILKILKSMKDMVKQTVVDSEIFGEFGLEYLGPIDGNNFSQLISALETAKNKKDGPVVVHVMTKKGKGYLPCEQDQSGKWHGVGPFDVATGEFKKCTQPGYASWSKVMSSELVNLAKTNQDIVAITPAMIAGSELRNFFQEFPSRSFDCGIAEEHATTFAGGLAISGKRPYLCIYSSFLQRAYDQLNHDLARMDLPVVIGIDRAGLVGADGPTHHGVFDIGFLRALPNVIVSQPADAKEANDLLATAFAQKHPFAIRYPRGNTQLEEDKLETGKLIEIGTWVQNGSFNQAKAIVLSYGASVREIEEYNSTAKLKLAIVNCRFIKPLDYKMLEKIVEANKPIFVYEPDMLADGLGSAILEWANSQGKEVILNRFGIPDQYVGQGSEEELKEDLGLDLKTFFKAIKNKIK